MTTRLWKILIMANHLSTGKLGEDIATAHLESLGFTILARNWRFRRCEIDIIAALGNTLHFVEVKAKTGWLMGLPENKVNAAKVGQMKMAAEAYLFQFPAWKSIQFDIVAITLAPDQPPDILLIEDIS